VARWGLPRDYALVSAEYSATRSQMAKEFGLGAVRKKRVGRRIAKSA
jgi:predicted transcriptional regulator